MSLRPLPSRSLRPRRAPSRRAPGPRPGHVAGRALGRLAACLAGYLALGAALLAPACAPSRDGDGDDPGAASQRDGGGRAQDGGGGRCEGRACQVPRCAPGQTTEISGRLLAGNGADPVPGATVFVPLSDLPPAQEGVSCDLCTQSPPSVATAQTGVDGAFRLRGVPAGSVPVVAQLGRFRRVLTLQVQPCADNPVPADADTAGRGMRLPRKNGDLSPDDRIPRIAVASGDYDQIECVLSRMGVKELDLYNGRAPGTRQPPPIGELAALLGDETVLNRYNLVVINCTDNQYQQMLARPDVQARLERYVGNGGRLYVTDWAYDVIEQVPELSPYLCFEPQSPPAAPMCGGKERPMAADSRSPYGGKSQVLDDGLRQWLGQFPGTIDNAGKIAVDYSFVIVAQASQAPGKQSKVWLEGPTPKGTRPQTVTFDYNGCGRVHFSTYNTEPDGVVNDLRRWPSACKPDFSPQERILEYLLFNVSSCIAPLG